MEQTKTSSTTESPVKMLVDSIVKGIQEKKGQDITVIDLKGIDGAIAQYFVICQGNTPTQVEAITDSIAETTRIEQQEKPVRVVGLELAQWVAMDYTDVMVHIFVPDMRNYYNIESLWQDAKQTEIPNLD
jgi:ribosome-associated protein